MARWMVSGPRHLEVRDSKNLLIMADRFLDRLPLLDLEAVLVNGLAVGMDRHLDAGAKSRGIATDGLRVDNADWNSLGLAAGNLRNEVMAKGGTWHDQTYPPADHAVVFWNGLSKGTRNAMATAEKCGILDVVYFSNGAMWTRNDVWSPLAYGLAFQSFGAMHWGECYARRMRRNHIVKSLHNDDGSINWLFWEYAEKRARDAFNWLSDGNIPWTEESPGTNMKDWYMFPSTSRKGAVVHHTRPDAQECTCEGWDVTKVGKRIEDGRQACKHMHIVWMWNERYKLIEEDYR